MDERLEVHLVFSCFKWSADTVDFSRALMISKQFSTGTLIPAQLLWHLTKLSHKLGSRMINLISWTPLRQHQNMSKQLSNPINSGKVCNISVKKITDINMFERSPVNLSAIFQPSHVVLFFPVFVTYGENAQNNQSRSAPFKMQTLVDVRHAEFVLALNKSLFGRSSTAVKEITVS